MPSSKTLHVKVGAVSGEPANPVEVDHNDLLNARGGQYELALPTWKAAGEVMGFIYRNWPGSYDRMFQSGYMYNWFQMLGKLMRALSTPYNLDHWDDLIGYAKLIRNDIAASEGVKQK